MTQVQPTLPFYTPRDRGKLYALRNILAAITDELRTQAPVAEEVVKFAVQDLPHILRQHTPLNILSAHPTNPTQISPYPFEILDLVSDKLRPDVFPTVADLARRLDIPDLSRLLQHRELIGIDESQVDSPLPHSALTFLKSVAFRMYQVPGQPPDEQAGPIVSEMRMRLSEDESFESENKLVGYIRNNFVGYVSGLTALAFGRNPYIVLHGPLVRAIGGFSGIIFDYATARELFNINLAEAGEFEVPTGNEKPIVTGDAATRYNLPLVSQDAVDGDKNLRKFNEFCLKSCGRQCAQQAIFPTEAVPPAQNTVNQAMIKGRSYPGFCLYFWMLRSLLDFCRLSGTVVVSAVEDVSAATEMTRLVLPSLLAVPPVHTSVSAALAKALKAIGVTLPTQANQRPDLYRQAKNMIDRLTLSDSNIFSYVLDEGEYTAPVQAYRYQTRNTFIAALADSSQGILNNLQLVLDALFPSTPMPGHPGYRVLMSYLRTTPLREPIRVEYFDLPDQQQHKQVMGSVYLLSLPYQEYGIPILLYYADKLARTPTKLIRTIIEREYMDLVLKNRFSDPVSILRVLGRLTRGYFQREGLQ